MSAYLYQWTHKPTGKWYVGSRTAKGCHINDGYICSSKQVKGMISEDESQWERKILVIGNSEYIANLERAYLRLLGAAKDPSSYNLNNADGKFFNPGVPLSEEIKTKISSRLKGKKKGPMSSEHKKKLSESKKGRSAPNKGISMSQEQKDKIALAHLGKKRSPHSEETKIKISVTEKITKSKRGQLNPNISLDVVNERRRYV